MTGQPRAVKHSTSVATVKKEKEKDEGDLDSGDEEKGESSAMGGLGFSPTTAKYVIYYYLDLCQPHTDAPLVQGRNLSFFRTRKRVMICASIGSQASR